MATMEEIAKKAGVSQATVSRVINGNISVSSELREKVMFWVRKMDYQPNATARSLVNNKTNLIGVLVPDISNPYFSEVVQAIEEEAEKNGYNIILCNSTGNIAKEKKHIKTLQSRQVDGILMVPTDQREPHIKKLKSSSKPIVVVTQILADVDSVAVDHVRGGFLAARHLIDLGHTSFGFIGGHDDVKFKGFLQGINASGLVFDKKNLIESTGWLQLSNHNAYNKVKEYLKKNKGKVLATAFFAYNDLAAFGVIQALEDYGYKIPEDIAVMGFDNTSLATVSRPALTSISQPTQSIGRMAIDLLIKRISSNQKNEGSEILLEPRLIIRETTVGVNLDDAI